MENEPDSPFFQLMKQSAANFTIMLVEKKCALEDFTSEEEYLEEIFD